MRLERTHVVPAGPGWWVEVHWPDDLGGGEPEVYRVVAWRICEDSQDERQGALVVPQRMADADIGVWPALLDQVANGARLVEMYWSRDDG